MGRLKPDPIPEEVQRKILDAAIRRSATAGAPTRVLDRGPALGGPNAPAGRRFGLRASDDHPADAGDVIDTVCEFVALKLRDALWRPRGFQPDQEAVRR